MLEVGGYQPFSTSDWPGRLAAVVFVQGCPWRCGYCHNPGLQPRERTPGAPGWPEVAARLQRRRGLLDGVVFSGGEPTIDAALPGAVAAVRALGLGVGLHTAGIYPRRLAALLPALDWVGLDLKCDPAGYDALTGVRGSVHAVRRALELVVASGVAYEVRTTVDPALIDQRMLASMAAWLRSVGCTQWVLQRLRRLDGHGAEPGRGVPAAQPVCADPADPELAGLAISWR